MNEVLLGFEVGSGNPVRVPITHTVVTGITQAAGKTTCLEGLIARSRARSLCFLTKRGEGSFAGARRSDPYFKDQGNWQFVASILEASRGEKMRFERPWVIRASAGATTLARVHKNVKKALETAKGMSGDIYLCLDAYLDVVVPQIDQIDWAQSVELEPGINAMDLTELAPEMQHLVIRSSLDWVLNKEEGTVVVIPEAWKFIPEGRGTPVKLGAEAFIRQAAALHNYLWLDSQDIAGIAKIIIKSVPLWILGVQRESNEVKRTLDQIPAGIKKPRPEQIATLGLGEFFACWGSHVIKTYAQPAWMSEAQAQEVARGHLPISVARREYKADFHGIPIKADTSVPRGTIVLAKQGRPVAAITNTKEPDVTPEQAKRMETNIIGAIDRLAGMLGPLAACVRTGEDPEATEAPPNGRTRQNAPTANGEAHRPIDEESLYQSFKARLIKEAPVLLRVVTIENEIELKVERRVIEPKPDSWMGMVGLLVHEGFTDKPVGANAVWKEAQRKWNASGIQTRAYEALEKLATMGFLTKEVGGYQAVPAAKKRIRAT